MTKDSWRSAMPARMSYAGATAAAALTTLGLRQYAKVVDPATVPGGLASLVKPFALILAGELAISFVYFAFIYPFYISPLRDIPTPEGAHWLLGHLPQLIGVTPGAPSRKWYASQLLSWERITLRRLPRESQFPQNTIY